MAKTFPNDMADLKAMAHMSAGEAVGYDHVAGHLKKRAGELFVAGNCDPVANELRMLARHFEGQSHAQRDEQRAVNAEIHRRLQSRKKA